MAVVPADPAGPQKEEINFLTGNVCLEPGPQILEKSIEETQPVLQVIHQPALQRRPQSCPGVTVGFGISEGLPHPSLNSWVPEQTLLLCLSIP